MLDKFDLSDEKLRDALDSSTCSQLREATPISGVAEREKSVTHQVNASQATSTLLLDEPRLLLASLSARAEPLSEKADLMSPHVPLLRWTPPIQSDWNALYIFSFERKS